MGQDASRRIGLVVGAVVEELSWVLDQMISSAKKHVNAIIVNDNEVGDKFFLASKIDVLKAPGRCLLAEQEIEDL